MKLLLLESSLCKLIQYIIHEQYDREKLYSRDFIIKQIYEKNKNGNYKAPKEIRKIADNLPFIKCKNKYGNEIIGTKIPEILYQYLFGNY